ncbi:MAG: iron export ABC transporter permease subunit FetB [Spirochaetales bacterium]|uniref:Iron export ABC transporter permease subunit FetB n=1 Tax=Candidatus Thalassospirochaeta sargassi TaxID=3119039 RepID=A0AAJ1IAF4_9SPIO|nr:iron export ABC transporter permease subunit FetB [Spirochaetales bacterium]
MSETLDISIIHLAYLYILIFLPLLLLLREGTNLIKDALFSLLRMTIQLGLVGFYLTWLFKLNNLWLNLLWVVVMLGVAAGTTVKRANLSARKFIPTIFLGLLIGVGGTTAFFILAVVRPDSWFDARYLIPLCGMIMGNSLRANVISLERFYSGIRNEEKLYKTYLMLGADRNEAVKPFLQQALKSSLNPTIATMATIGLVSLPGMMTGQMLGGSVPLTAIKYQIAIMLAIFIGESLAVILNLKFSIRSAFTPFDILKDDIFRNV